ncbi:MAG: NAD(P)/FAD-dependent oxidoreductase [Chitinophagaceae bacterium]|nr:NAD(P)/FAD-dependent oxidoreductase [Chitinophagaceae bacterium]
MTEKKTYDACIIGGGLAGLSVAIQLAKHGYAVALFEKEQFPFHKVCGEYISLESLDFIETLGLPISEMQLPVIKKLLVTAPNGNQLKQELPLGGFGISRYTLDNSLKEIALSNNVALFENCKVIDVIFLHDEFLVQTASGKFTCRICCGSFGKRSNLDVKWGRPFANLKPNKLNNYIGVKYHIKTSFPADTIALHNFKNGYCGISKIEEDKYCLCYLTNAGNLKANSNSIKDMEKNILYKNPHLENIFTNSEFLYQSPVTISQVSFNKKNQVENHVLLTGDAAGMITPLCGNGMSMALHAGKIASGYIHEFLSGKISRAEMETAYTHQWSSTFSKRLQTGRRIQSLFGKVWITNFFIAVMKKRPGLTRSLIKQTHGKPF